MARFDWAALMRAGLHGLQLKPSEFWALTPAELAMMLGQSKAMTPMNRSQLNALLATYPDQEGSGDE